MRIVQLANFYTPTSGGLRTSLDEIGRRYGELGHERVLVVPGGRDADEQTPAGRRITVRSPRLPALDYRVLVERRRVLRLLDLLRPDVLEISDKISLGWLTKWADAAGIPAVLFSHERLDALLEILLPARAAGMLGGTVDAVNRRLAGSVGKVVVSSQFAADEYRRAGAGNLRLVPLGVDLDVFRPAPGPVARTVRLVSMCRLSPEKRPERSIEALRLLLDAGRPATLLMIGDGPLRSRLQRRAVGLPVRFLGHVPDRESIARLVAAADIAVAPGAIETFGLSVLESLACGTPVVVPNGGAARELAGVPGAGIVTDGTPTGLADGVRALLDIPAAQRRAAARARAELFPWSATVAGLLDVHDLEPAAVR